MSAQNGKVDITDYFTTSILSFGIWVGVLQWIVLRTVIPISMRWILVAALTPWLSIALVIPLFSISKPLLILVFGKYALVDCPYLDQALAMNLYYPGLFRGSLLLEGAYFEAYVRHQSGSARQWFDQIQDTALIPPYSLLRTEAALLFAEGDRNAALVKAEQGLASAQKNQFMRGAALAETE